MVLSTLDGPDWSPLMHAKAVSDGACMPRRLSGHLVIDAPEWHSQCPASGQNQRLLGSNIAILYEDAMSLLSIKLFVL